MKELTNNKRHFYAGYCAEGVHMNLCRMWEVKTFNTKSARDEWVSVNEYAKDGDKVAKCLSYSEMKDCINKTY